jgi:hypothetical protein
LFNVDEIGLTVVQHKVRKVLAMEGKKQVACLPSAQRGVHCRRDIHECFVYLRAPFDGNPLPKHPRLQLETAPPETIGAVPQSGWIQVDSFTT